MKKLELSEHSYLIWIRIFPWSAKRDAVANRVGGFHGDNDDRAKDKGRLVQPRWKHKMIFARWSLIVAVVAI